MRTTDCANRETVLRLIQSIPFPNAEPFKIWLAQSGEEALEREEYSDLNEGEDKAEAIFRRLIWEYRLNGRDQDWIDARIRVITGRQQLTDAWKERDVQSSKFGILTNEIHQGTFGLSTREHKTYKEVAPDDSLRDNMSSLELLFTSLSESLTKEMIERLDARGFQENREVAREAGYQTGESRKRLEKKTGIKVLTKLKWLGGKKRK